MLCLVNCRLPATSMMLSATGLLGSAGTSAQAESRLPGKIVAAAVEAETPAIKRRRVISCSRFSEREPLVLEGESAIFRGSGAIILSRFHQLLYGDCLGLILPAGAKQLRSGIAATGL